MNKKKLKERKVKKLSKKSILVFFLMFFLILYCIMVIYHTSKKLPKGISLEGEVYEVDEGSVEFLYDLTYRDNADNEVIEQKIFDRIFLMINNSQEFILLDFFLFDTGEGTYRNLSSDLVDNLIKKKKDNPHIKINFMTDTYNTFYGSLEYRDFERLEENGINVSFTNLNRLRDSNPLYSGFWRIFFEPFGTPKNCKNSLIKLNGKNYCVRSALKALNTKANHRKVIVADGIVDGVKKVVSLIASANPSSHGSKYSNVALYVESGNEGIWKDIYYSEKSVADYSKESFIEHNFEGVSSSLIENKATVQFVTEGKIKKSFVGEIDKTEKGESIEIAQFLLAERDVIDSLIKASKRGVEVRIVLDPSRYLFGKDSKGIPNRVVASELVKESNGNIQVRWYDTHGEEFHSKIMIIKKNNGNTIVFVGSANLTRRNIGDYNLEADVKLTASNDSKVIQDVYAYFERIWQNKNGSYTLDYQTLKEDSLSKYLKYRVQEASGICLW
jgi:HKD family nuclease